MQGEEGQEPEAAPAPSEISDLQTELYTLVEDQRDKRQPPARCTEARLEAWSRLLEQASNPQVRRSFHRYFHMKALSYA